jgi:hypothetical protein
MAWARFLGGLEKELPIGANRLKAVMFNNDGFPQQGRENHWYENGTSEVDNVRPVDQTD